MIDVLVDYRPSALPSMIAELLELHVGRLGGRGRSDIEGDFLWCAVRVPEFEVIILSVHARREGSRLFPRPTGF